VVLDDEFSADATLAGSDVAKASVSRRQTAAVCLVWSTPGSPARTARRWLTGSARQLSGERAPVPEAT